MRSSFVCVLSLLFVAAFAQQHVIEKDTPISGSIEKKGSISYLLTNIMNWRVVSFAFQAKSDTPDFLSVIASVSVTCNDKKMAFDLVDGLSSAHYSDGELCESGNSTITIVNKLDKGITFWGIAADQDRYMYPIMDNTPVYGAIVPQSDYDFVSYRAYVGKSQGGSGSIDFVNVTVHYDMFSDSTLTGFVAADNPRPTTRTGMKLNPTDEGLFLAISRNDKLFCEDCYLYVVLVAKKHNTEPLFYNVQWSVDRGIIRLVEDEAYTATIIPDNHGQHFVVDMRQDAYDSDIYLGFQKSDCYNYTLTVDVALTSFDDGEWDTCEQTTLEGVGLREWGIRRQSPCHRVGGVLYIRVWDAKQVAESCTFSIVYRITRPVFSYLYKSKSIGFTSKKDKVGIAYYKIVIPKEEFVDVTSLTVTMKDVFYTSTGSFWYGYDVFYGPQTDPIRIFNPLKTSTYVYTSYVNYKNTVSFTVTEDQEGWCTDCTYFFAARTTNETAWVVSAELGYVPFMLLPNEPRSGTLKPYTGEIESYVYLSMETDHTIEIACLKKNEKDPDIVLYVSTIPHANATNHGWKDSTVADFRAEVEIGPGHPDYCNNCFYYISVFFMDEASEDKSTDLELSFNCPEGVCKHCKAGFDPSKECKECLPGYFGKDCKRCTSCNHGHCDDGISGSGSCLCNEGWGPAQVCNECLEGYWGVDCQACESCNGHGTCNSGLHGDGKCKCETNFDDRINCEDCKPGFFGETCEGVCPATEKGVCNDSGKCFDKMEGDGHCLCKSGMVGIKCDTAYADDKCSPHCVAEKGACDEEKGICVCYGNYSGKDCNSEAFNVWITISIVSMSIIIVIVFIFAIKCIHGTRTSKRSKKGEKAGLLNNSV